MELNYEHRLFGSEEEQKNKKFMLYTASMKYLDSSQRDEIKLVKAKHYPSYGKNHVKAVLINNSKILLMPCIYNHFMNLVAIHVIDCGLQEISKEDLQPLNSLKLLYLKNNSIQSLAADLFHGTPLIERLCFQNNKIRFISQHTLTPLMHLKYANFKHNVTIDELYASEGSPSDSIALSILRAKIVLHCAPPDEQKMSTVTSYVRHLWEGDFSDFKIKARDETVFDVHKLVLAVNSPVFAAMYNHAMEENLKNEMIISNFCPDTIKEFLAFVYVRQIPQKCFKATELYAMADEYQVKELSERIQWHIVCEVNGENATEMFKFGELYHNEEIKQTAFRSIEKFLNMKLPTALMESVEDMMELLEVKDKLDEVVKRVTQSYSQKSSDLTLTTVSSLMCSENE